MSERWGFGGLIGGGVVFFASRMVLGHGWVWFIPAFTAWCAIAVYGIWRATRGW